MSGEQLSGDATPQGATTTVIAPPAHNVQPNFNNMTIEDIMKFQGGLVEALRAKGLVPTSTLSQITPLPLQQAASQSPPSSLTHSSSSTAITSQQLSGYETPPRIQPLPLSSSSSLHHHHLLHH